MPKQRISELLAQAGSAVGAAFGSLLGVLLRPILAAIRGMVRRERAAVDELPPPKPKRIGAAKPKAKPRRKSKRPGGDEGPERV